MVVITDFLVRFHFYEMVLCENKANPEKKCHGNCQLVKKLKTPSDISVPILPGLNDFSTEAILGRTYDEFLWMISPDSKRCFSDFICYLCSSPVNVPTPPPEKYRV